MRPQESWEDDGILSEAETAEYWKNRRYFEEILPVPPFYEQGNPEGAITWFKDTEAGNRIYEQLTFYRDMAAKYGLALYLTECNELPGEVIYEDDYQIAVKNQRNDLPLQTRKIQA